MNLGNSTEVVRSEGSALKSTESKNDTGKDFDLSRFSIRSAKSADEVNQAMKWATEEGWNVGKHDGQTYYEAFKEGCKLLMLDDKTPIGAIFLAAYGKNFVFIGLYILEKNYRGNGLGKVLWQHAMKEIESFNAALYAVPEQIDRYKKSGFNFSYNVNRWNIKTKGSKQLDIKDENTTQIDSKDENLLTQISEYDARMFPKPRFNLIKLLLKANATIGFVIRNKQQIEGYGIIRECQRGYRLGPLYANTLESAKNVTERLLKSIDKENQIVIVDSPSEKENHHIKYFHEYFSSEPDKPSNTQAMSKDTMPPEVGNNLDKLYGACSLELG